MNKKPCLGDVLSWIIVIAIIILLSNGGCNPQNKTNDNQKVLKRTNQFISSLPDPTRMLDNSLLDENNLYMFGLSDKEVANINKSIIKSYKINNVKFYTDTSATVNATISIIDFKKLSKNILNDYSKYSNDEEIDEYALEREAGKIIKKNIKKCKQKKYYKTEKVKLELSKMDNDLWNINNEEDIIQDLTLELK